MGRPRQITDERILVVARECFLELGPSAPTAVIAERLGISQAVLFQRFATKEELLRAALTPPDEAPWHALADQGPDGRPLAEQLTELANAIDSFFREIFPCIVALRMSGMGPACQDGLKGEDALPMRGRCVLTAWFERARAAGRLDSGEPAHLADMLIGALQIRPWLALIAGMRNTAAEQASYVTTLVGLLVGQKVASPRRPGPTSRGGSR